MNMGFKGVQVDTMKIYLQKSKGTKEFGRMMVPQEITYVR